LNGIAAHFFYAAGWVGFGLVHSGLARDGVKSRLVPLFGPFYRIAYNLVAATQIALVVWVGWFLLAGRTAYPWPHGFGLILSSVHLAGWVLLIAALMGYDLGRLAGTAQVRNHFQGIDAPDDEPLRRDGFHRFVRHPVYAAGFLILWGAVHDELSLATAIWASLYFLIGTHFEERWLNRHYGAEYEAYRHRVPAYIPWKGRAI
jgi:methanethiol S-methyltransferase